MKQKQTEQKQTVQSQIQPKQQNTQTQGIKQQPTRDLAEIEEYANYCINH